MRGIQDIANQYIYYQQRHILSKRTGKTHRQTTTRRVWKCLVGLTAILREA